MENTAHFLAMSSVLILEFSYSQQLPYSLFTSTDIKQPANWLNRVSKNTKIHR